MENKFKEAEKFRYLILASQRQGNRIYKDLLFEIGVTPSKAEVISILMKYQPMSLKELGAMLICESGSPSRLVERMVKDKLVERVKEKNDSRFVRLQLTSLGIDKYKLIVKAENQMYKILEEVYTEDELQLANQVLSRFLLESPLSSNLIKRGYIHKSRDNMK
ncbi:MarR family winged helix-turn-helix transcriptional regulator [Oceanobacillus chungangensis]|uniref:MarR family transcriptional regulator n=1 Tax=Oceanobacillus chungangensis TaxID=1229152 RepID=A0A3D8PHL1_9BACI|nr:winged helix DNA-binding protein [Oceanobacillus chungangensis]RDW15142.1 MarR family transcriptional regulator [Oceanobacillus chungangensis]